MSNDGAQLMKYCAPGVETTREPGMQVLPMCITVNELAVT